jgi:hypothetical protein
VPFKDFSFLMGCMGIEQTKAALKAISDRFDELQALRLTEPEAALERLKEVSSSRLEGEFACAFGLLGKACSLISVEFSNTEASSRV